MSTISGSDNDTELDEAYLKVEVDYAPASNGKKFNEWCKKYDFDPLNSERRAWCSPLRTYFRGASGVAFADGEMFLFYKEDLVDVEALVEQRVVEAEALTRYNIAMWAPPVEDTNLDHYNKFINNIWTKWAIKHNAKIVNGKAQFKEVSSE